MVDFVTMRSRGPWYSPRTRALGVLAARAVQSGFIAWTTAEGFLATEGNSEMPVPRTMRQWARKSPDYPERAVSGGLVHPGELPAWARQQLRHWADLAQRDPRLPRRPAGLGFESFRGVITAPAPVMPVASRHAPRSSQPNPTPSQSSGDGDGAIGALVFIGLLLLAARLAGPLQRPASPGIRRLRIR